MSTHVIEPTVPRLAVFDRSDELRDAAHEQVVFCHDTATGLRAIIALHDTTLGPALGGTRYYPYANEALALTDVLRLSAGMTHKAAAAGMPGDPSAARPMGWVPWRAVIVPSTTTPPVFSSSQGPGVAETKSDCGRMLSHSAKRSGRLSTQEGRRKPYSASVVLRR